MTVETTRVLQWNSSLYHCTFTWLWSKQSYRLSLIMLRQLKCTLLLIWRSMWAVFLAFPDPLVFNTLHVKIMKSKLALSNGDDISAEVNDSQETTVAKRSCASVTELWAELQLVSRLNVKFLKIFSEFNISIDSLCLPPGQRHVLFWFDEVQDGNTLSRPFLLRPYFSSL